MVNKQLFNTFLIIALSIFSCSKDNESYESSIVLHLDFNGNTIDKGDFKNSVYANGVQYAEDSLKNPESAIYFDGEDDYISIGHDNCLDLDDGFTFSAWINPSKGGGSYIFHKQFDDGGGGPYSFDFYYGHIRLILYHEPFDYDNIIKLTSHKEIKRDVWQHVAATYDGELCKIFYNGQVDTIQDVGKIDICKSTKNLGVGTYLWVYPRVLFKGEMDNLRIYNKALKNEEIEKLYRDYD